MITYNRLWVTMKRKKISQYRLIKYYGFSSGQLGRLKKNMYVSTHTINVLCQILDCAVEEIMEYHLSADEKPVYCVNPGLKKTRKRLKDSEELTG